MSHFEQLLAITLLQFTILPMPATITEECQERVTVRVDECRWR